MQSRRSEAPWRGLCADRAQLCRPTFRTIRGHLLIDLRVVPQVVEDVGAKGTDVGEVTAIDRHAVVDVVLPVPSGKLRPLVPDVVGDVLDGLGPLRLNRGGDARSE